MIRKKVLLYHLHFLYMNVPALLAEALRLVTYTILAYERSQSFHEKYHGIHLVLMKFKDGENDFDKEDSRYLQVVKDALDLIKTHDPRRFVRVQREIKWFANDQKVGAQYFRLLRVVNIAANRDDADVEELYDSYCIMVASMIVHEATHGALFSRYVPYTSQNLLRVEWICHTEEVRFVRKLPKPKPGRRFIPYAKWEELEQQLCAKSQKRGGYWRFW